MKVLVVEDDAEISSAIRSGLEKAGFFVEIVRDGERALRLAMDRNFSVIILDLMLPSMDGLTVCRKLRAEHITVPILMLTAKDSVPDRVAGLEAGADDYLSKPFEFDELLARVRALLRRESVNKSAVIQVADLVIDTAGRMVTRAGRQIDLTQREFTLVEALAAREGQVLSRDWILQTLWVDEFSTSNTVDVHIRNLRRKIDEGFAQKLIHTIFGAGYVLRAEPTSP